MDSKIYKDRFYSYVDGFRENGMLGKLLEEKLEHIERVAEDSVYIAKEEGWSSEDIAKAELCGFYHDVGRFSQYVRYKTFSDSKSVNHGQYGYEVILADNMFEGMLKSDSQTILDAVRFHNALEVPKGLGEESVRFTKLIRDADKIDIFFQLTDAIEKGSLNEHTDLLWDYPIGGKANPVIVEKLLNGSQALYSDIKTATDVCLLQLCWLNGMTYRSTFKKLKENRTIELIERILPNTDEVKACLNQSEKTMGSL